MQGKSILWLDNDPGNIESLVTSLRAKGFDTTICRAVSQAEATLQQRRFDLLILDVMIPVTDAELSDYPFESTDDTLSTGLMFYNRMRERLVTAQTPVLVMTVRIDSTIANAFRDAGLPEGQFATRYEMRNTPHFLEKVASLVRPQG